MAKPTGGAMRRLRRLGRYLLFAPRVVWRFAWQPPATAITAFTDSDWAGCKATAWSTSGGVLMLGSRCIKAWSVTQKCVTLSSAEAELMALIKGATEAIGLSQLAETWCLGLKADLFIDSSAALAIAQRRGSGRLRHVRIGQLLSPRSDPVWGSDPTQFLEA